MAELVFRLPLNGRLDNITGRNYNFRLRSAMSVEGMALGSAYIINGSGGGTNCIMGDDFLIGEKLPDEFCVTAFTRISSLSGSFCPILHISQGNNSPYDNYFSIFIYSDKISFQNFLGYTTISDISINNDNTKYLNKPTFWYITCEGGLLKVYADFEYLGEVQMENWEYRKPLLTNGISIGGEQDGIHSNYNSAQSFRGSMNDVRFYKGIPSQKELKEISMAKYVHLTFENHLNDVSGCGNHLTTSSGNHSFLPGIGNTGEISFKGDGTLDMDYRFSEYTTSFTPYATIMFYIDGDNPTNYERIIEFCDVWGLGTDLPSTLGIYVNKTKYKEFYIRVGTDNTIVDTGVEGIKHVAVIYNHISRVLELYINGELSTQKILTNKDYDGAIRQYSLFSVSNGSPADDIQGNFYIDDFRIYGKILSQDEIQRIINERYFIDDQGNLFCYKKKVMLNGAGFKDNGVAEFEDIQEGQIDGTDDVLGEVQNGKILKVNKIFEGY